MPGAVNATEKGSSSPTWTTLLGGALVGSLIVAGFGPSGLLLPRFTGCELGGSIGSFTTWALLGPLNKPPGVNVSESNYLPGGWNFTFSSGALTVGTLKSSPSSGGWEYSGPLVGVVAIGTQVNWTVFRVQNASRLGGPTGPCTQPYVAEMTSTSSNTCGGPVILPIANESDDTQEFHVWNGTDHGSTWQNEGCVTPTAGAYVWFDTSLHADALGASREALLDTCNESGTYTLPVAATAQVPTILNVPLGEEEISMKGYQAWFSHPPLGWTAEYFLPEGWFWVIGPVGPVASPINPPVPLPGLVAFLRDSC